MRLMAEGHEGLAQRIEAVLAEASGGGAVVQRVQPLSGGACQDNFEVHVQLDKGPLQGARRLVLRSDARRSLPGSIDRRVEFAVIQRAVAAGVPTPRAHFLMKDVVREGSWAYFLEWVEGEAIGRRVTSAPELEPARERLPLSVAEAAAAIHRLTPDDVPGLAPPEESPGRAAIRRLRALIDRTPEAHPALELGLSWLSAHEPVGEEVTLVHGDFRTGNFMVAPSGFTAVLDWEFAHLGSPLEDLGWLAVRDWRFGRLDRAIGGFAHREPFYRLYEEASGRKLDREALRFWEVAGNLRWAAGALFQGERYLAGESRDLELIAIPRRAAEMEFEALRLITQAD